MGSCTRLVAEAWDAQAPGVCPVPRATPVGLVMDVTFQYSYREQGARCHLPPPQSRSRGLRTPWAVLAALGTSGSQRQAAVLGKQSPENVSSLINPEPCHLPGL